MSSVHTELLERHRAVMPSWLSLYYEEPIELVRGEGRRVWDADGREYLDFFGGILTTMTAHALPEVVGAVKQQAERIMHSSTLYLIRSQVELAEEIARLAPVPDAKVFFTTSGTEANEAALLLATTARRSSQVLALRNSYHGRSFAAMSITGNRGWSASSLSPFNVSYVHSGYRYRSPFRELDDQAFTDRCVEDLRDVLTTATAGDVACMIAEPIQGVGGFSVPPDGFFSAMKEVLDGYGILFISDEVQTGWGRTGDHFWGIDAHQVTPDIITFAKGLGNGLTVAGVAARAELMDGLTANSISTFGGNPLSSTGARANLRYLLEHDLQGNARKIGEHLLRHLVDRTPGWPAVGEVRGKGLMIGLEMVMPGTTRPDAGAATAVLETCKEAGLLIGKGGLHGNVLRIAPPMTVTRAEADEALGVLDAALAAVTA
jgi:4-aminobutyrate aminotransferase